MSTTSQKTTDAWGIFQPRDDDFIVQTGYEIISDQASAFAVPRGSPQELIQFHCAAHKAYFNDYSSIDYVLRVYGGAWKTPADYPEPYRLIYDGTSRIRSNVENIVRKGNAIENLPDRFGLVAAEAALFRLQTSFRAACVLCETRMGFEVFCLAKLILEQIAWAYAVYEIEDELLYKVKPSNCINRLKRLYPRVGRMYGFMNDQAHMDPKTISDFTKVDAEGIRVVLRDADKCLLGCWYLLQLTDVYGACTEVIYRRWYTTFEFINKRGTEPKLRSRRKSRAEIKMFEAKLFGYLHRKEDQH